MLVYSQHPSEGVSNTVQKDVGIDGTKEDKEKFFMNFKSVCQE